MSKAHPPLNIVQAIRDKNLFGSLFKDLRTWAAWIVLLKTVFAMPMDADELALYQKCTGRKEPPKGPFRELWAVIGRRAGKSWMIGAILAVFLALFYDFTKYLNVGERGVIQIIAADRKQAQVIFRYIRAILHTVKIFLPYILNETKETIELSTGIDIEVATCSFRSIRGRTVVCAICDEIAFWRVEGANPDREIINAIRPSMATILNAVLIVISSPYGKFGVFFEHYRDYFGKDESDEILVWQAATRVMNPTIPEAFIEKERKKDPASAKAEYDASFREDIETYVNPEIVRGCVVKGRIELPPLPGVRYVGFVDPAGGSGDDSMTLAISHAKDGVKFLDLTRERKPPFSPDAVVEEYAGLLKSYRISKVTGDRYAGEWPAERFRVHGIRYEVSAKPKSDLYRDFLPLLNSGQVELLDNDRLVNQIVGLERRTASGGHDTIDHGPGGHDDLANVAAGSMVEGKARLVPSIRIVDQGDAPPPRRTEGEAKLPILREGEVAIPVEENGRIVEFQILRPRQRHWIAGVR